MAQTFNLPTIGDAMVEGEIVEWFVAVGDEVALDQAICSIETDKSVVELTTPYRGTVLAVGGAVGDVVPVGQPLLVVGDAGEQSTIPAPTSSPAAPTPATSTPAAPTPGAPAAASPASQPKLSPILRQLAAEHSIDPATLVGTGVGGRITRWDIEAAVTNTSPASAPIPIAAQPAAANGTVRAMPKVRKAARDAGIDLRTLAGSGPGGAVTLSDLGQPAAGGPAVAPDRRERLSAMRRSIAAHLTESVQTIPQFMSSVDVDATAVLATRQALRERLDAPVPIDAVLMSLLIPVLRDHPLVNAMLDGDEVVYYGAHNIGVAVDTPDGLMVPVVHGAGQRSIGELAAEIVQLAAAARGRTIDPASLTGATCTINNVGAIGIVGGTPILPLGTSTIIAFGVARPVVQLRNGNPVEVPTITISATFDHRLLDGGDAGRFLTQLKQHLEVPALALL